MTYDVFIGWQYLNESPSWYRNFIVSLPDLSYEGINYTLKQWQAEYTYTDDCGYLLRFATEQDYVMFLLRWS